MLRWSYLWASTQRSQSSSAGGRSFSSRALTMHLYRVRRKIATGSKYWELWYVDRHTSPQVAILMFVQELPMHLVREVHVVAALV